MCRFYVNKISASHQATRQTNTGGRGAAQDSKPSDSSRQFRIVTSSFVTACTHAYDQWRKHQWKTIPPDPRLNETYMAVETKVSQTERQERWQTRCLGRHIWRSIGTPEALEAPQCPLSSMILCVFLIRLRVTEALHNSVDESLKAESHLANESVELPRNKSFPFLTTIMNNNQFIMYRHELFYHADDMMAANQICATLRCRQR
jgi:hypothetical protein